MRRIFVFMFCMLVAAPGMRAQSDLTVLSPSFMREFFFGSQPSARTEAMGRAGTALGGDLSSTYFNPAGLAELEGIAVAGNYASAPYYYSGNTHFKYYGLGWRINKDWAVAVSMHAFDRGRDLGYYPTNPTWYDKVMRNYSAAASWSPFNGFSVGLAAQYYRGTYYSPSPAKGFSGDLGVRQIFKLNKDGRHRHDLILAASCTNLSWSKMHWEYNPSYRMKANMPVIQRDAIAYTWTFKADSAQVVPFDPLKASVTAEYEMPLNYEFDRTIKAGAELTIYEILTLRCGYYYSFQPEIYYIWGYYPTYSTDDITYGVSVNLPLQKLSGGKLPLNVRLDYASLSQVYAYPYFAPQYQQNVHSFGLTANYLLGSKKK